MQVQNFITTWVFILSTWWPCVMPTTIFFVCRHWGVMVETMMLQYFHLAISISALLASLNIPPAEDFNGYHVPYGLSLTEKQRVINCCLSRSRQTIENAFGILSSKWRILCRVFKAKLDLVDSVLKACVSPQLPTIDRFCKTCVIRFCW